MSPPPPLSTPLTTLLGISHPVLLAGMDQVAGPELAAAVTNAGGFGTLGGARYTPRMLREMIAEMKALLKDERAPFGVDLLLPQVGGGARATNVSFCCVFLGEGERGKRSKDVEKSGGQERGIGEVRWRRAL
jgi:hypothetical protein